jgi:hypothetical protein
LFFKLEWFSRFEICGFMQLGLSNSRQTPNPLTRMRIALWVG